MQPPKATDDYGHGQMMGMLVIIALFEAAQEANVPISAETINSIKKVASRDLGEYLNLHDEDVLLLVNEELRKI